MATWSEVRAVLSRLRGGDSHPLTQFPDPRSDSQRPPFRIGLAAWAEDVAEDLHRRFGSDVALTVGALTYPGRVLDRPGPGDPGAASAVPDLDPARARVALDGPLSVRSGHSLIHGLLVTNQATEDLAIISGRNLIASVVDPDSGVIVGGYSGLIFAVRVRHVIPPGETTRIPLLVATDSLVPELGYAIPPGAWGIRVTIEFEPGPAARTPALPVTITSS